MNRARAVFLDRDNTLLQDPGYNGDPEKVCLMPDASSALRLLRDAGYSIIVVTNQSGVARGLFTEEQLQAVNEKMRQLLRAQAADVDAVYYCPFYPGEEATVAAYRRDSELRKPKPGMLLKAAAEMNVDLSRSWMVGDRLEDVQAGRSAGCRTILIDSRPDASVRSMAPADLANIDFRAQTLSEASRIVERYGLPTDPGRPTDGREIQLLTEIRDHLDRLHRHDRQSDFSLFKLAASLVQLFALAAGLWGCLALFGGHVPEATARFVLALFLQLLALTTAMADRSP